MVAYILFNDYSPSTQTVARRLEVELILLHTLAVSVQRAMTIIPELLLLLPELCSISSGTAYSRLKDAFPSSQDPLLEIVSLLNIMRQLHSLCESSSDEGTCYLSSEGAQQETRIVGGKAASPEESCIHSSLLPIAGTIGSLRAVIRRCPYIVRSLSLHIAQADNILRVFSTNILRFPLVPHLPLIFL